VGVGATVGAGLTRGVAGEGDEGPPPSLGDAPGSADGSSEADGPALEAADGSADGVGVGVGVADGPPAGPDETTSATEVPRATDRPAAGSVEMTDPSGTVGSGARVVEPTCRPALVRAKMASAWGDPTTSGTAMRSRTVETVGVIAEP